MHVNTRFITFSCYFMFQSKIHKRAWVLHECLERMPENIDAMRELLQYGLRGTDAEALATIGRGEDEGRSVKYCVIAHPRVV